MSHVLLANLKCESNILLDGVFYSADFEGLPVSRPIIDDSRESDPYDARKGSGCARQAQQNRCIARREVSVI